MFAGTLWASMAFDVVLEVVLAINMFACRHWLDLKDDAAFSKRA